MAKTYVVQGAVADRLTISGIDIRFPRNTVSLGFFTDNTYSTPVTTGLTGAAAIEGIANGNQQYSDFDNSPVDISVDGSFASAATPVTDIRVTPTSFAGAAFYRVTVTGNMS